VFVQAAFGLHADSRPQLRQIAIIKTSREQ